MERLFRLALVSLGVWMVLLPFMRPMTFLVALVTIILGLNVIIWSVHRA